MKKLKHKKIINKTNLIIGLMIGLFCVVALNSNITLGVSTSQPAPSTELKNKRGAYVIVARSEKAAKEVITQKKSVLKSQTKIDQHKTLFTTDEPHTAKALGEGGSNNDISVYENRLYQAAAIPNDPKFTDNSQWNLNKISATGAWDVTTGSEQSTIAVVDSGVLWSQFWPGSTECTAENPCVQPDIPASKIKINTGETGSTEAEGSAPNCTSRGLTLDKACNNLDDDNNGLIDDVNGWDFMGGHRGEENCPNFSNNSTYNSPSHSGYVAQDNDPQPYSCDNPNDPKILNKNHYNNSCNAYEGACFTSHGTSVAGVAAASTNNHTSVAGLDWQAKILPIRALDGYGYGDSVSISSSIDYAVKMGADVINLSLATFYGGGCSNIDPLVNESIKAAYEAGVVVVAAAGNGGLDKVCYPANSQYTIAVGASDSNDKRASFSNFGSELDVVAPGQSMPILLAPTTQYNSTLGVGSGTSFATPHISGLASLLKATQPDLTPDKARDLIRERADKVSAMNGASFTKEYGYGRVNASKTLQPESTIKPLNFVPMISPRNMVVKTPTRKVDLTTGQEIEVVLAKGRIINFVDKIEVDGKTYLRTKYDRSVGAEKGILMSTLNELPRFAAMTKPRDMWLKTTTQKVNILSGLKVGENLYSERIISFNTSATYDGVFYLRSRYETSQGSYSSIPYNLLGEVPKYSKMIKPRYMRLKRTIRKTNLSTLKSTGGWLYKDQRIYFSDRATVNGVLYLRTNFDSNPAYNRGIRESDLY